MLTPDEFAALLNNAKRFVDEQLLPLEGGVEGNDEMPADTWDRLTKMSAELGLYAANVPSELGGAGVSLEQLVLLAKEFGRVSWPFGYLLARPSPLLFDANDSIRERYLEPTVTGDISPCFALTEPEAGSDTRALKTTARPVEGGYLVTGRKHYISHANDGDYAVAFARLEGDTEQERTPTVALIVDHAKEDDPSTGYTVVRRQRFIGWRGMEQNEIEFANCFVPAENMLGEAGRGLKQAYRFLLQRRIFLSAHCLGGMRRSIELTLEHVNNREVTGELLREKQGARWMVSEMEMLAFSTDQTVLAAARLCDESDGNWGPAARRSVSISKLMATDNLQRVSDIALQLHGGLGLSKELPIERIYRDARVTRIVDGANEVHKDIIARAVFAEFDT